MNGRDEFIDSNLNQIVELLKESADLGSNLDDIQTQIQMKIITLLLLDPVSFSENQKKLFCTVLLDFNNQIFDINQTNIQLKKSDLQTIKQNLIAFLNSINNEYLHTAINVHALCRKTVLGELLYQKIENTDPTLKAGALNTIAKNFDQYCKDNNVQINDKKLQSFIKTQSLGWFKDLREFPTLYVIFKGEANIKQEAKTDELVGKLFQKP